MIGQAWQREQNILSLLDDEFLAALLEQHERELYARIAALDVNELPIEYIEGRVTGGSINIDGNSAVRRTCSLTMVSDNVNINDVYWGIRTKFTLEIGVKNKLTNEFAPSDDNVYPDIIWFPQGTLIISSFNTSLSTNSCTISLQGKDKMCLLNGDLGGQLFASIDFGQEEIENKIFNLVKTDYTASDQFMGRVLYIKLDSTIDSANSFPRGPLSGKGVSANNYTYSFSVNDESGKYYRQGDYYFLIVDNNRQYEHKYDIYKLVEDPIDLFVPATVVNPSSYSAYKYFYKPYNTNEYYIIGRESSAVNSRHYYTLRDLYEVSYEYTIKHIPIEKIIRESVHAYAKEPYYNIVINDLDKFGLEQLQYKGDVDLYALRNYSTGHFAQMTLSSQNSALANIVNANNFHTDTLSNSIADTSCSYVYVVQNGYNVTYNTITLGQIMLLSDEEKSKVYSVAIIKYGDDIGYRVTNLTYPGDLVSSIGDTLTTILDKIKTMLGDFEYFYDVEGHFVFQRKKIYVNTSFSQLTNNGDETYVSYGNDKKKFSFNFEGNRLISAIQNAPVLNNLRNDFAVWGKRTTVSGAEVPIHARYAIDKKPQEYLSLKGVLYITEDHQNHVTEDHQSLLDNSQEYQLAHYTKNTDIIPSFLNNEDWYELKDWAEYYKILTGAYPSLELLNYCTEGYTDSITFPDGNTVLFPSQGQLIIDLDKSNHLNPLYKKRNSAGRLVSWAPFQHRANSCHHTYAQFLSYYDEDPNMISFVYRPTIPSQEVIAQDQQNAGVEPPNSIAVKIVDWREIIYQMALDYFAGQGCSELSPILDLNGNEVMNNPDHFLSEVGIRNPYYYPTGYTGYEQYYTDMEGFWRQLYNPDYIPEPIYEPGHYDPGALSISGNGLVTRSQIWTNRQLVDYQINYYISDENNSNIGSQYSAIEDVELMAKYNRYCHHETDTSDNARVLRERRYWNVNVFENPESLNFWFDFLDDDFELAQFSVPMVGDRSKTINEDKATAIVFKEIPDLILTDTTSQDEIDAISLRLEIEDQSGYTFIYLPKGFSQYLTMSYRNLSVKNKIDELLYKFAYCIENITITALPVYHLQPNTRIYVHDETTKINGEYLVSKLTIPLNYNGTMSITATKAPERLY